MKKIYVRLLEQVTVRVINLGNVEVLGGQSPNFLVQFSKSEITSQSAIWAKFEKYASWLIMLAPTMLTLTREFLGTYLTKQFSLIYPK